MSTGKPYYGAGGLRRMQHGRIRRVQWRAS